MENSHWEHLWAYRVTLLYCSVPSIERRHSLYCRNITDNIPSSWWWHLSCFNSFVSKIEDSLRWSQYWFIDQLREIIRSLPSSFFCGDQNEGTVIASAVILHEAIVSDSEISSFLEFTLSGRIWRRTSFGTEKEKIRSTKTEATRSTETWLCGDPWSTKRIGQYRWLHSLPDRTIIWPSSIGFVSAILKAHGIWIIDLLSLQLTSFRIQDRFHCAKTCSTNKTERNGDMLSIVSHVFHVVETRQRQRMTDEAMVKETSIDPTTFPVRRPCSTLLSDLFSILSVHVR